MDENGANLAPSRLSKECKLELIIAGAEPAEESATLPPQDLNLALPPPSEVVFDNRSRSGVLPSSSRSAVSMRPRRPSNHLDSSAQRVISINKSAQLGTSLDSDSRYTTPIDNST